MRDQGGLSPRIKTDNKVVLTVKELADYLKVSPATVYCHLKRGQLPAFRVGKCWRFNIELIDHADAFCEKA
jgi:excisionase family DNA binding protein